MRLFVGIPLAPVVLNELSKVTARLRSSTDDLRWTSSDFWHITLQFLGNSSPEQYPCLVAHLSQLKGSPVPIHLGRLGIFDRAGVFFAEVDATPSLVSLAEQILAATSHCGFVAETRPFHPHITLARAKGQGRSRSLQELAQRVQRQPAFLHYVASEFLLYESHLASTGATYEVRHRFPLTASAGS